MIVKIKENARMSRISALMLHLGRITYRDAHLKTLWSSGLHLNKPKAFQSPATMKNPAKIKQNSRVFFIIISHVTYIYRAFFHFVVYIIYIYIYIYILIHFFSVGLSCEYIVILVQAKAFSMEFTF